MQAAPVGAVWDHPRVRGEQCSGVTATPVAEGPSPRARGAVEFHANRAAAQGTIPACAGSRLADLGV